MVTACEGARGPRALRALVHSSYFTLFPSPFERLGMLTMMKKKSKNYVFPFVGCGQSDITE